MHIGYIGLGKMGLNRVQRLIGKHYEVTAFDPSPEARERALQLGARVVDGIPELVTQLGAPRTLWIMVPHQAVEGVLAELKPLLTKGDTIIEGGNSPYQDTQRRAQEYEAAGIRFIDAGVSGGPGGAKAGACIMVGGTKEAVAPYESLFKDLTVPDGYLHAGASGAGHFVKMVHNGIEYGMMQALAEGFDLMKTADPSLNLTAIAKLYNHGSVIESRLVGWLAEGYEEYGTELDAITGSASASGEGQWTVETAQRYNVPVPVIEDALRVRAESQKKPSYQGKLISVMRTMFGGHDVRK